MINRKIFGSQSPQPSSANAPHAYANAFDIFLQSIKIEYKGYFFIKWKRGRKVTHSLKYESDGKLSFIKQNLTLNISLTYKNGRPSEKSTVLSLVNANEEQIDQITLPVHRWASQYTPLQIPINKGLLKAKVRKRQLMELKISPQSMQSPALYSNVMEEQQGSDFLEQQMNTRMIISQTKNNRPYIDSHRDEVTKLRKQLEDTLYVNNKLKNDRSVLLSKNIELENQIKQIKLEYTQELKQLQKYYSTKVQLRQTIYQDEINNMVTVFNSNTQYNSLLLGQLIQQMKENQEMLLLKKGEEDEKNSQIEVLRQKIEKLNQFVELQQKTVSLKQAELKIELSSKEKELTKKSAYIEQKESELSAARDKILQYSQQLKLISLQFQQKQKQLQQIKYENEEKESSIKNLKKEAKQQSSKVQELTEQIRKHRLKYSELQFETGNKQEKIKELEMIIEEINQQCQQSKNQLEFTESAYKKQRQNNESIQNNYREHIKRLQQIIRQKQQSFMKELQELTKSKQKETLHLQQNYRISQEMNKQLQQQLSKSNEKLAILNRNFTQLEADSLKRRQELQRINSQLKQQIQKVGKQTNNQKNYSLSNNHLSSSTEVEKLKAQIEMYTNQVEKLQKQINLLRDSNIKLKEQLNFISENAIKVEDHDRLQNKVLELEAKLSLYEQNQGIPHFQKGQQRVDVIDIPPMKQAQQKKNIADNYDLNNVPVNNNIFHHHNISFQIGSRAEQSEKLRLLEQELHISLSNVNELKQINQQLENKIIEQANMIEQFRTREEQLRRQLDIKLSQLKIIQYCESEQENSQMPESLSSKKVRFPPSGQEQISKFLKNTSSAKNLKQQGTIKNSESFSQQLILSKKFSKKDRNLLDEEIIQQSYERYSDSQKKSENQIQKSRKSGQKGQAKNHLLKYPQQEKPIQRSEQKKNKSKFNSKFKRLSISKDQSQINIDIRQSNQQYSKSDENQDAENRSRQSFISGTTLYKYQRVSHKQKIKRLEKDIQEYEEERKRSSEREKGLLQQIEKTRLRMLQIQNQLKIMQQDKHSLKASLHFELQRKNLKQNKNIQTEGVEKASKSTQANIIVKDQQKVRLELQFGQLQRKFMQIQNQLQLKSAQSDIKLNNLSSKLQYSELKGQQLAKQLQQRSSQCQRLKKDIRQKEDQLVEDKNNFHSLKLEKNQFVFQLERYESQSKKYKARIEQLEEKIKKNDVVDVLRQTQFQLENSNKKIMQLNRHIYQGKLEKDTLEDEIKLLRKKISEVSKKYTQLEYSTQLTEKSIEDFKRKEAKHRREIEDKEDSIDKLRQQIKRNSDEISSLKTIGNQYILQKKKHLDELNNLHHLVQRKDYQILNIKKQLEKLRYKMQEKEDQKAQKKNHMRKEIQSLEMELNGKNKEIYELQSTIKQLNIRLEFLSTENKRNINEKTNVYSEKLKVYVEEIASIKKQLGDNSSQNNSLRYQLREYEEQIDHLKSQSAKLQNRLAEELQNKKQLIQMLDSEQETIEKLRSNIQSIQQDLFNTRNTIKGIRLQLESEKREHNIKKQQLENLNKANEQLQQQANKNRVKISQYETQLQINRNYNNRIVDADKQLKNLSKQLKETKKNFQQHTIKYVYTANQFESSLKSQESKLKQKYENLLKKLEQEYQNSNQNTKKHLESEVLQLLSEVSQVRIQSQKKSELISELEFKITKLQILPMKVTELEKLYKEKNDELSRLKQSDKNQRQLRSKIIELSDLHEKANKVKEQAIKQLKQERKKLKEAEECVTQDRQLIRALQKERNTLMNEISEAQELEKNYKKEIQNLLKNSKQLQQDKNIYLNKLEDNRKQYNTKIVKLQEKLEEMARNMQDHESALVEEYEKNVTELNSELEKVYFQIKEKENLAANSDQLINKLSYELESYKKELYNYKQKQEQQSQFYEQEYNKLKNNFIQNEKVYKVTIQNLEKELQEMSKELSREKMKALSGSSKKIEINSFSNAQVSRLQEKIKQKDLKLDEMKQNIFKLEETIVKLKKKELIQNELIEKIGRLQKDNSQILSEKKKMEQEWAVLGNREQSQKQNLKSQNNQLKSALQKIKANLQQKEMLNESLRFELQSLKQLYNDLQKQLEKRKNALREKIDRETRQQQEMQIKLESVAQYELQIQEMKVRQVELFAELDKKNSIVSNLQLKILEFEKIQTKLKNSNKSNAQGQHYRNQIKRLSDQNEFLQKQNRKMKDQLQAMERQNQQAKTKLSLNQSSIDSLQSTVEEISMKCKEYEGSHKKLEEYNEACFKVLECSLEQALTQGYLMEKISERQNELNNLLEELQQLKFLNERKLLDEDELRRENYELQLRLEDAEFAQSQVDELRQICDKLQQQKKDAIFREEILKVQIQNLLSNSSTSQKQKQKVDDIIRKLAHNNSRFSFS